LVLLGAEQQLWWRQSFKTTLFNNEA
jgi:hypothetical protein